MGQVSSKLRRTETGFAHWCPACGQMHRLPDSWTFVNGDLEAPTFAPSFRHSGKQAQVNEHGKWTGGWVCDANGKALDWCCHYILTEGVLNFCTDCTHALAGQSVPLPVLPTFTQDKENDE